ncbi:MAG TPA: restriction endonuclease [Ramlibacter sp.]|jgi:restriction system protein|uniref:restriction endonuclease n=1 Tax=Ramlibacter sp. TaxID=1917967 RepID=UPI002D266FEB|nr:restriction endonuclease [Ramlibacter sp.]HZY19662.1 restriction endonuclease [Ramlibacter sp.]
MADDARTRTAGPSRPLLVLGFGLVALAGVMLLLSLALAGTESATLRSLGRPLRAPLALLVLLGVLLALVGHALRPRGQDQEPQGAGATTWLVGDSTDFVRSALAPDTGLASAHRGLRPPEPAWSSRVFRDIEWERFEAVCVRLFALAGLRAQDTGAAAGPIELWQSSGGPDRPVALLLCRHPAGLVGIDEVRAFRHQVAASGLRRGILATGGSFTPDAQRFASEQGIDALDGAGLLQRIGLRTPPQQSELLQLAYQGEYWRPTCVRCGLKMVESASGRGREPLWTCADAPRCRFTLPVHARD